MDRDTVSVFGAVLWPAFLEEEWKEKDTKPLFLYVCVSQGMSKASDQHNSSCFLLDCGICKKLLLSLSLFSRSLRSNLLWNGDLNLGQLVSSPKMDYSVTALACVWRIPAPFATLHSGSWLGNTQFCGNCTSLIPASYPTWSGQNHPPPLRTAARD